MLLILERSQLRYHLSFNLTSTTSKNDFQNYKSKFIFRGEGIKTTAGCSYIFDRLLGTYFKWCPLLLGIVLYAECLPFSGLLVPPYMSSSHFIHITVSVHIFFYVSSDVGRTVRMRAGHLVADCRYFYTAHRLWLN